MTRILAWNIRSGGGARAHLLADSIVRHEPDIAILTEYRPAGSARLLGFLASEGFVHHALTTPNPRIGGVAIASRQPIVADDSKVDCLGPFASRMLIAHVPGLDLSVCGLYGPLPGEAFSTCWRGMLDALEPHVRSSLLVMGDFNTGQSLLDAPQRRLLGSDYFAALATLGYVDLWRREHGDDAREHTWHGRNNPYRIDHAFGSPTLVNRVRGCWYSHAEREQKVSDHSITLVDLDVALSSRLTSIS